MMTGTRDPNVIVARDEAMIGGSSTRGFWSKRRQTATALITALGLVAGIAVAYKLFEQNIPNNVVRDASSFTYTLEAQDLAAGELAMRPVTGTGDKVIFRQSKAGTPCDPGSTPPNATAQSCNVDTYPGDERRTDVIIKNTNVPAHSASWHVYVDPTSIVVTSYNATTNSYTTVTDATLLAKFRNLWQLRVDKQTYFSAVVEYENNPNSDSSYAAACGPRTLTSLTRQDPCDLGVIKAAGTMGVGLSPALTARPTDDRQYRFYMSETDDGSDQSQFLGWRVTFSLVFVAQAPAEAETGRTSSRPI